MYIAFHQLYLLDFVQLSTVHICFVSTLNLSEEKYNLSLFNAQANTSNWLKVFADIVEDCSEDFSVALGKAARISKNVFHKSKISFSKFSRQCCFGFRPSQILTLRRTEAETILSAKL